MSPPSLLSIELSLLELYKGKKAILYIINSTSNTTENTTNAMDYVTLTEPQRHKVYIVKYNFDRSRPEGDWAIYVQTKENTGDIHFIASEDAGAPLCYTRETVRVHEIKKKREGLVPIGTTLTQNYPSGWDEALRVVEENLQIETSLALPGSTQAGARPKVSRWTQECARPALERAGLLEKMKSKEIEKKKKEGKKEKEEGMEGGGVSIWISGEDEK